MRRALVLASVLVLATSCGGKPHTDVVLRPTRPGVDLDRAARAAQTRLRAFHVDASVRPRGERELVVRLPGRAAVDAGVARAGGAVAVYDLEASIRPDPSGELACGPPQQTCPGVFATPRGVHRYRAAGRPAVGPTGVRGATTDSDSVAPDAVVVLHLTRDGRRAFHVLTRRVAVRGNTTGTDQHFAVVYARRILSWPSIDYSKYPDGVDDDTIGVIGGSTSRAEAIALAIDLTSIPGFRVEKS